MTRYHFQFKPEGGVVEIGYFSFYFKNELPCRHAGHKEFPKVRACSLHIVVKGIISPHFVMIVMTVL